MRSRRQRRTCRSCRAEPEAQGPGRLPHRPRHGRPRRQSRHHDRQGHLRDRCACRGHAARRRSAAAGLWRFRFLLRCHGNHEVLGVLKVVRIDRPEIPSEFQPIGGPGSLVKQEHLGGDAGRDRLKITWEDGPNAVYSSDSYRADLEAAARRPGKVVRDEGNVDEAMAKAVKRVSAGALHSASRAGSDGATGCSRADQGWPLRSLGLHSGPASHSHSPRRKARTAGRQVTVNVTHRRRLRAKVEAGLRARGRSPQPVPRRTERPSR